MISSSLDRVVMRLLLIMHFWFSIIQLILQFIQSWTGRSLSTFIAATPLSVLFMQRGVTLSPPDLVSAFLCSLQASFSVSRVFQRPLRRSAARWECALSLHRVYSSRSPLCMLTCARMTVWLHCMVARARAVNSIRAHAQY